MSSLENVSFDSCNDACGSSYRKKRNGSCPAALYTGGLYEIGVVIIREMNYLVSDSFQSLDALIDCVSLSSKVIEIASAARIDESTKCEDWSQVSSADNLCQS